MALLSFVKHSTIWRKGHFWFLLMTVALLFGVVTPVLADKGVTDGNNSFVALGSGGTNLALSDGITWTGPSGTTNDLGDLSASPIVQIGINPNVGDSAGIFVGLKDIRDTQGNIVPNANLAGYQIDINYDHSQAKVLNVYSMVYSGYFFVNNVTNPNVTRVADVVYQGTANFEKLFFVPLALTGNSNDSTNVIIKFNSLRDQNLNLISIPDVILTFQRGKIYNEASNKTLSIADAIAGLQYLANLRNVGLKPGEVNLINMASILPPEPGATVIRPSITDIVALLQKLVGLRDDSFQSVQTVKPALSQVSGYVYGLELGDFANVTLGNDKYLQSTKTDNNGLYSFTDIPDGEYFVKIDLNGYRSEIAKEVTVLGSNSFTNNISNGIMASSVIADDNMAEVNFNVVPLDNDKFTYHWEQDVSRSGYEQSAYQNQKPIIIFLDETIEISDNSSTEKLLHDYNIILSNEKESWTQEYSYRLLDTMGLLPQHKRDSYSENSLKPSKWILTDEHLLDDIQVDYGPDGNIVTISQDAFVYASPKLAMVDGLKGTFFSKRLHHALVSYVTSSGTDIQAVERILIDRFGCTTIIPSYENLTLQTTGEDANRFQQFKPDELIQIINMFEEMPEGYHVVKGLKYLVRRIDGIPHPRYPLAAAVAWPMQNVDSYIEFMDVAFLSGSFDVHRLIIHEKAHFLWENLFSEAIKQEWISIGGWYENSNEPDGWSTTKTTEFVTAYAHAKNPNEDMAESLAYFILNPDQLMSRAIGKYEFIRDYIMHGDIYISKIRDDLTFEVLNLYPDYNYPGKIKRIDISVEGKPDEDKKITVEIELNIVNKVFDGADSAFTRLHSEIGTYNDMYLSPINVEGSVLRGTSTISKYAKSGLWFTDQIVVTDSVGNQRFEGENDFGWKLFIDNPLEDVDVPQYVPNSMSLNLYNEVREGHEVQRLNVSWQVNENKSMKLDGVYASVTNPSTGQDRLENWGSFDPVTGMASVDFYFTDYSQSGTYGVPYIMMVDEALNQGKQFFSNSPQDEPLKTIEIFTNDGDDSKPELDLNRISVKATPTHPEAPDGETLVEITYFAKDDKSGVGIVGYSLLDPQGIAHLQYHYHENFYTIFFEGNPTEWKEYKINVVLPRGSAPGIWGIQEINISDKAGNRQKYNFVETMHFNV